jgi:ATP-dependent Zn protease
LDRLAQELLKRETLDKEDVDKILADLIPQPVG